MSSRLPIRPATRPGALGAEPAQSLEETLRGISSPAWPRFAPGLSWEGWSVIPARDVSSTALNYTADQVSVDQLIAEIFPNLNCVGLARVLQWLVQGPLKGDGSPNRLQQVAHQALDGLASAIGQRSFARELELLQRLSHLSSDVQIWMAQKGFGLRELSPLRLLSDSKESLALLESLAKSKLSRAQAAQAMEWGIELLALDPSRTDLAPMSVENSEEWLKRLKQLRYPKTLSGDETKRRLLERIPRPVKIHVDWVRRGDHDGIAISFEAHTPHELQLRARDLLSTIERLSSEDALWKS